MLMPCSRQLSDRDAVAPPLQEAGPRLAKRVIAFSGSLDLTCCRCCSMFGKRFTYAGKRYFRASSI